MGNSAHQGYSPTLEELDQLVAFLPRFSADGFLPVKAWKGGGRGTDGVISMPWPDYEDVVSDFFDFATDAVLRWKKGAYLDSEAVKRIDDPEFISNASLDEIQSMLTWCVRGERFCTGHWQDVIESGTLRRLLERVAVIRSELIDDLDQ